MKIISLLLFLILGPIVNTQTPTVTLKEIDKFEGQIVTLCEKVTSTQETKANNIFLNFGKPYPNSAFTIVIFAKGLENFSYNPIEYLKNKTICVTGKVIRYNEKLEMIITKEDQILVK